MHSCPPQTPYHEQVQHAEYLTAQIGYANPTVKISRAVDSSSLNADSMLLDSFDGAILPAALLTLAFPMRFPAWQQRTRSMTACLPRFVVCTFLARAVFMVVTEW